ncbi:MAG TPA: transglutaminase N-terminal domain-containing protein, partial [Blastocatellia bacterium]
MEVRMQPLSEGFQRCMAFELLTSPHAKVLHYRDHLGNTVHHFDIPAQHRHLEIVGESIVYIGTRAEFSSDVAGSGMDGIAGTATMAAIPSWSDINDLGADGEYWDVLNPSKFVHPSPLVNDLAAEIGANRDSDPVTVLRRINEGIHQAFTYSPRKPPVSRGKR